MSECELIERCGLLQVKLASKPATAALIKKRHCMLGRAECARWMVHRVLGGTGVPPDLYPTETDRALALIDQARA